MDDALRAHRDAAIAEIDDLIRRGCQMKGALALDAMRMWQRDCAAVINQVSGGSKAHWLARAYSSAFLVRANDGGVVVEASASEIVDRIIDVLEQGRRSLSTVESMTTSAAPGPPLRRFDFVHNQQLRPILAEAFADVTHSLESGDIESSFIASCGILEALITDALEHKGLNVSSWSFDARIEAAEREGLIKSGCARLPAIARRYRDLSDSEGRVPEGTISARDARLVKQVLAVVIRDLDPGR